MSVAAMTAVKRHSEAKGVARLVMFVLADYADACGIAWPGVDRVAHDCRVDRATVFRHLTKLEQIDELARFERAGRSSVYLLLIDGLDDIGPEEETKLAELGVDVEGVSQIATGRSSATGGVATVRPVTSENASTSSVSTDVEPERGRRRSAQEDIAMKLVESDVVPTIKSGAGYDATTLFAKVWRQGWRECVDADLNPVHFATALVGAYFELLGDKPDYARIGRLCGAFGIYALLGIEAALMNDVDNWLAYATAVAKAKKREAEARREEASA